MRKNKKLLLASVAAMGALALGVGATSTFAWFAASEGSKKAVNTSETLGVTDNEYSVGNITLTVSSTDFSAVKLSDTDGYSYVLVGGSKQKDTAVAQNHSSLFSSSTISISATVVPVGGGDARAATAGELKAIADNYRIALTGSNNAKLSTTSGANALAQTANNTIYITFTISDAGEISALSASTVYAGVQGKDDADGSTPGNQPETASDFTTNKPTMTATLQYQSADDPVAWSDVATA